METVYIKYGKRLQYFVIYGIQADKKVNDPYLNV